MKQMMLAVLTALLLLLTACQSPAAEVPPSGSAEPPVDFSDSSPSPVDLPEFITEFAFDRADWLDVNRDREFRICLLDESQTALLHDLLALDRWTPAADVPAVGLEPAYILYSRDGSSLTVTYWDADSCLVVAKGGTAADNIYLYHAPVSILDAYNDFMSGLTPLPGTAASTSEHYYDLFRADPGLVTLSGSPFTDDQLAAYAIQTMAYQGRYDFEKGNSKEEFDAVTQKHFGLSIQNYDNSMSKTLDSGRVTATGWSFDSSVYMVLNGDPTGLDGIMTGTFQCYDFSDSLWTDGEFPQEKLDHIKEYLLTGNDDDFPEPYLVEIAFEERFDEETQTPYVFYHSLKVLEPDREALSTYRAVLRNQQEFMTGLRKEDADYDMTLQSESTTLQKYLDDWTALNQDNDVVFRVFAFSLCDLDHDGTPEVILDIAANENQSISRLILHYACGTVYGYHLNYRGFSEPKTDGTFFVSDGAFDHGIAAICFDRSYYTYDDITYCRSDNSGQTIRCYVNHQESTLESFDAAMELQNEKPGVVWYDFTEENIEAIFSAHIF